MSFLTVALPVCVPLGTSCSYTCTWHCSHCTSDLVGLGFYPQVVLIYSKPLRFLFSAKWFACRSGIPCKFQVISNPPWLSIFTLYKVMWTKAPKRNCSTVTLLHGLTDRCIKTVELGWCRFTVWLQLSWAAYLGLWASSSTYVCYQTQRQLWGRSPNCLLKGQWERKPDKRRRYFRQFRPLFREKSTEWVQGVGWTVPWSRLRTNQDIESSAQRKFITLEGKHVRGYGGGVEG